MWSNLIRQKMSESFCRGSPAQADRIQRQWVETFNLATKIPNALSLNFSSLAVEWTIGSSGNGQCSENIRSSNLALKVYFAFAKSSRPPFEIFSCEEAKSLLILLELSKSSEV